MPLLAAARDRLRLTHQTGPNDLERVAAAYRAGGFDRAEVAPYLPGHGRLLRPGRPRRLPGRGDHPGRARRRAQGRAPRPLRRGLRGPPDRATPASSRRSAGPSSCPRPRPTPEALAGRILHCPRPPRGARRDGARTSAASRPRTRPAASPRSACP
ncbi:MAG: hypothetical protein MZV70_38030 [Desulfobacterales bacterium]|nr:hypothetical protein [Desulfobacterales bacterium]